MEDSAGSGATRKEFLMGSEKHRCVAVGFYLPTRQIDTFSNSPALVMEYLSQNNLSLS